MLDLGGDVTGNGISKRVFTILSAVAENERDRRSSPEKLFAPTRLSVANVIQAGTGLAWRGWRCQGPTSRYVPSTATAAVGSTLRRKPTARRAERITELDGSCH